MSKEILTNVFKHYITEALDQPTEAEISRMLEYCKKGFFEQIIYHFPTEYISIVLKYYEYIEDYRMCGKIFNKIIIHNKVNSAQVPTKI